MNIETFVEKANKIHKNKYDYSKVYFESLNDIITIKCDEHGEFQQRVSVHINDECGCKECGLKYRTHPSKKSSEQFIQEAREIHGDRYDYSKVEYKNANTPVLIHCKKHGDFLQRPSAHITQRQKCPSCGEEEKKTNRKTTEQFIKDAKEAWGEEYDYSMTEYVKKDVKIKYRCEDHGVIEQKPILHIKHGCPYCNGRGINKYDIDSFIAKAREVHGDRYDYSQVKFINVSSKVTIKCEEHGEFIQRASNHINGDRCPKCFGGVKINTKEYIERAKNKHGDTFDYSLTQYTKAHEKIKITCRVHGEFEQLAYMHLQSEYSCPRCVAELTSSLAEKEIVSFLQQYYSDEIIANDRDTFGYREIDILIPGINLGIEFNGNYWHTEAIVGKDHHLHKSDLADDKGIKLIQIFEHQWNNKRDIVKSRLLSVIGANKKIHARKTEIVNLSTDDKNNFLEKTHIQGKDNSSICLGLTSDDVLVACMTFGKSRYDKNFDYELIRFSSDLNTNVVGGAGKLFKEFRKNYSGSVISYADRQWSTGEMYKHLGFRMDGKTTAGYFYYHINNKTTHSRLAFQKHRLKEMPFYNENLSEYDIMKMNGYERIWNSGNIRWIID